MAPLKTLSKNLPYLIGQLNALLDNTSPLVKFICGVSLIGYFLSFSKSAVLALSVTPGYIVPPHFNVWTAFTYCFLEIHFWEVLADIVAVGLCGKLIEPLWGRFEMFKFFIVVNLGVAVIASAFYFILYTITANTDLLFFVHIHGLAGYTAGLSVAVRQIMPDHCLVKTPLGKMTNRNIPLLVTFLAILLYVLGLLEGTSPTSFASGVLVSWTYLRFYQPHSNGSRGDLADNFTFASFFPTVLQPPISVIANTIHSALVKVGICRRTVRRYDISAAPTAVTVTLPGNDPQDVERRRQIALKALNERLAKSESMKNPGRTLGPSKKKDALPTSNTTIPVSSPSSVAIDIPSSLGPHLAAANSNNDDDEHNDDPNAPLLGSGGRLVQTTAQVHTARDV
ncbi:unnamed protein product [Nesidiocoris tenuis]|uniref:Uncharacterized protein n=2 Tax=Nesidiocoris tenuis TaxID=355587 RepID=A0A6H5HE86_9HEMI|nr:Eukaryotic integral membrane protein (DUF1751) [Nesidiocoris tenuis]CAB0011793.1 unnamed protein product [Nesidiocoris tenuis]